MHYRREIDGLRALAVIPVILFHAGFETFSGGFAGVDVFFVISGYLITSIILAEKNAGTFSLVNFYERRARRILPALFLVMIACLPGAWLWMAPSQMKDFSQGLIAVTIFVSNVFFWKSANYFATVTELNPLIHTWSLGVEEQYYLLFPLFLIISWRLGVRWIISILVVVGIVSLTVAHWASFNWPTPNFYLLPSRGWELLIGAGVSFYSFHCKSNKTKVDPANLWINQLGSILGFLLIGYAIIGFDKGTPFPSLYALMPTLGAALIILFAIPQTVVGSLLGSKLFVGIGLISYSTYLWHQPLFAFARLSSINAPSSFLFLLLSIISIALAYFSWRFVELPMRNKHLISRSVFFFLAIMFSLMLISLGIAGNITNGFNKRFSLPNNIVHSFDRTVRETECFDKPTVSAGNDLGCFLGVTEGDSEFMVIGDSHSLSLLDAFDEAGKKANLRGTYAGASGCTPLLGIYALRSGQGDGYCHLLNEQIFEYVKKSKVRKLFLVSRWSYYTDGGYDGVEWSYIGLTQDSRRSKELSREAFEKGVDNTVNAYSNIGVQLYIVVQVPQQKFDPKSVYYKKYTENREKLHKAIYNFSISEGQHRQLQSYSVSFFEKYLHSNHIKLVSFDSVFCVNGVCLMGNEDGSYYFDRDHLSSAGSMLLVDEVKKQLVE